MSGNQAPRLLRDQQQGNLYLIINNRRRRILFPNVASHVKSLLGIREIEPAAAAELGAYDPGAIVPRTWGDDEWIEPPQNKQKMREIIVSRLEGKGIEFGAGSRPLPTPLAAHVEYAEPFQSADQYERMNYTTETVRPAFSNPIEDQYEIADGSLDFLAAAHVIEHTPNPIGAIVESFRVLRKGGQLVLIVPDKRRTFDKTRQNTTLDHLIADYEKPDRSRDFENYLDFYENAKKKKDPQEEAQQAHSKGLDIHYHVWTPGSFSHMFKHIQKSYAPFDSIEIKPPVADENCLEFYAVAIK